MRKAIASFPSTGGTFVEREVHVLTDMKQFPEYEKLYPTYAKMVKKNFKNILDEGEIIIVQSTGGYCTESGDIKVVKYLDAPNWTVEKKDEIEKDFILILSLMGMDIPSNFEDIVQFIYEDVCETADPENWSQGDVVIGFRRWIESQSK
jgi:hypothetical protein